MIAPGVRDGDDFCAENLLVESQIAIQIRCHGGDVIDT